MLNKTWLYLNNKRMTSMNMDAHISVLQSRHDALEHKIIAEDNRPAPDQDRLRQLKVQKLHIKQEIVNCKNKTD